MTLSEKSVGLVFRQVRLAVCPKALVPMGALWPCLDCRSGVLCSMPCVPFLPAHSLDLAAKGNQDVQKDDRQPSLITAMAARLLLERVLKKQDIGPFPLLWTNKANIPTLV